MSERTKFATPKFKHLSHGITTDYLTSSPTGLTYHRESFELRSVVARTSASAEFGLHVTYVMKDGNEVEWDSLSGMAHRLLSPEDASDFYN